MSNLFLTYAIPELVQKLTNGELSTQDLVKEVAKSIKATEEETHAWVCYDVEQLLMDLNKPSKASSLGSLIDTKKTSAGLGGIPFGVKDIFNTKAFPTEMGSPIWKNFTPGNNARVVDSLLFAGGLLIGKTVTAEFAVHALNETLNPHHAAMTPGTSSSGSAAAVARGMVPFALASQTAGSIIRPASFCGVWGMKPSFGMIPRTGVLKTTDSLDTIGFVAAHAKSLRPILHHTRVKGPNYPFVYEQVDKRGDFPKKKDKPWRVGFVKTHTWDGATDYAKSAIQSLVNKISHESNFIVEEIRWPNEFHEAHATHATIYAKSLAYYFQNEKKMSNQLTAIMSEMIDAGEPITSEQFLKALEQQTYFIRELDKLFAPYDFIVSLGTSSSAPQRYVEELPDPSLLWTLGHLPSIAAPSFRCPHHLPFGVQFTARKWNDYVLLQGIEELVNRELIPAGSQAIHSTEAMENLSNNEFA